MLPVATLGVLAEVDIAATDKGRELPVLLLIQQGATLATELQNCRLGIGLLVGVAHPHRNAVRLLRINSILNTHVKVFGLVAEDQRVAERLEVACSDLGTLAGNRQF